MCYETVESKIRKSEKTRLCEWCHKPIKEGELYSWSKSVDQDAGEWWENCFHTNCQETYHRTLKKYSGMQDELIEELLHWGPYSPGVIPDI